MNLIDESFENQKKDNSKKMSAIILVLIAILIIAIIAIYIAIVYMKDNIVKLYLDESLNEKIKEMMVIEEDGTSYLPIKEIAPYFGYESFDGEYTDKSEITSKCYVQCDDEIANFALNSNKIYKLTTSNNGTNYDYFYISKPVKAINGVLYAPIDAIEKAFNIAFVNDTENKRIYIFTMPYLIKIYEARILDYGYEEISSDFTNKKTILSDILIVSKNQGKNYGVIDVKGNTIIEPKYDNIEYLQNSGDFLVKSNGKVGIISRKREMKVQLLYENLELIDKELGLYIAKKDDKYGIIDSNGNTKVHIEYDQIGIDNTRFEENDIKNKYLLDNGMIPVKKDELWGAFDKNGNQILGFDYQGFGYTAGSNKNAINLLIVPEYNVMIARKNEKYTLINAEGKEICNPILDDVYMTISSGKKNYYMDFEGNKGVSVTDFLDSQGIKK